MDSAIKELDKRVAALSKGVPTFDNSAPGESIQLTDSTDNKVTAFALHGNATQKQYTGKNLLENTATMQNASGVTFTVNEDGSVTLDGTNTSAIWFNINDDMSDLPNGEYIFSMNVASVTSAWIALVMSDDTTTYLGLSGEVGQDRSFEITDDLKLSKVAFSINSGRTFDNLTFYPMIRLATEIDSTWEPYVGGIPSPNPDYPQDIEIAGASGSINVSTENEDSSLATSANISTPNGLAKIKYGHRNYVDENGQAWTTDDIIKYADGTGKKIQRIKQLILDGSEEWSEYTTNTFLLQSEEFVTGSASYALCDSYMYSTSNLSGMSDKSLKQGAWSGGSGFIAIRDTAYATVDELKAGLSAKNVVCYVVLKEPIITDLSAEEIAEIEKLQTFYPTTNISNDAGCVMEVVYKADVKNHIDNIILGRVATLEAALLNNI